MPSVAQIIAGFAIAIYLVVALIPCGLEDPSFFSVASDVSVHGMTVAPESPHGSHMHHGSRRTDADSAHAATPSHDRTKLNSSLVWTRTCLCGCSESRSTVGGGAARLGPAVPPNVLAFVEQVLPNRAAAHRSHALSVARLRD